MTLKSDDSTFWERLKKKKKHWTRRYRTAEKGRRRRNNVPSSQHCSVRLLLVTHTAFITKSCTILKDVVRGVTCSVSHLCTRGLVCFAQHQRSLSCNRGPPVSIPGNNQCFFILTSGITGVFLHVWADWSCPSSWGSKSEFGKIVKLFFFFVWR